MKSGMPGWGQPNASIIVAHAILSSMGTMNNKLWSHLTTSIRHFTFSQKPNQENKNAIEEGNKMYYISLYLVLRLGYMSVYEKTVSHTQGYRHFLKSRFTKSAESGSLELHGNNTHPSLQ